MWCGIREILLALAKEWADHGDQVHRWLCESRSSVRGWNSNYCLSSLTYIRILTFSIKNLSLSKFYWYFWKLTNYEKNLRYHFLSRLTMVAMRSLTLLAFVLLGFTAAVPTQHEARQTWVPGTLNNTQEFYIRMTVTDGPTKYNNWACKRSQPAQCHWY